MDIDPDTAQRIRKQMNRVCELALSRNKDYITTFDPQPYQDSVRFRIGSSSGVPIIETSGHLRLSELESRNDDELAELLSALSGDRF